MATGTADFTVPFTAIGGTTTMRVREIYSMPAIPSPCDNYSFGETEDYSVNILGGPGDDVGVIAITNPTTDFGLGTEDIIVTIQNYGSNDAAEFSVYYQVDGGTVYGGEYTGATIPAYGTASFTIPGAYDFTGTACYDITAWTVYELDENIDNDANMVNICNLAVGSGAYYIYSNILGGLEPWGTTTNTIAMTSAYGDEGVAWFRDYFETVDVESVFSPDICFVFLEGSDFCADELEAFLMYKYFVDRRLGKCRRTFIAECSTE